MFYSSLTLRIYDSAQTRGPHFRIELKFGVMVFAEGGKPEILEKKALGAGTRTNNKLNPHMALGRNQSNPGQIGERRALSPLSLLCSFSVFLLLCFIKTGF